MGQVPRLLGLSARGSQPIAFVTVPLLADDPAALVELGARAMRHSPHLRLVLYPAPVAPTPADSSAAALAAMLPPALTAVQPLPAQPSRSTGPPASAVAATGAQQQRLVAAHAKSVMRALERLRQLFGQVGLLALGGGASAGAGSSSTRAGQISGTGKCASAVGVGGDDGAVRWCIAVGGRWTPDIALQVGPSPRRV